MAEITIERLHEKITSKNVPILTLDERWYMLIPENEKPETIKKLENNLNELLKKQGQVNNDLKEVKKIKTKLINDVVQNMEADTVSSEEHQKKMEQSQRLIQEAKEKIIQLEDQALDIPVLLREANQALLVATVQYCYNRLNKNKEDIALLDKWITEVRIKLKNNLLIKQDKEIKNQQTYSYMHDVLGPDIMGIFDKINEE